MEFYLFALTALVAYSLLKSPVEWIILTIEHKRRYENDSNYRRSYDHIGLMVKDINRLNTEQKKTFFSNLETRFIR